MVSVVGPVAGICSLGGGGHLGEEGVPGQGRDLAAQIGRRLLDPLGPLPGGLDEGVLDGVVDAGSP